MSADPATIQRFLSLLWPLDVPEGEDLVVSYQRPGEKVRSVVAHTVEQATTYATKAGNAGANVWANIATRDRNRPPESPRGRLEDCRTVPALWADIDVTEGAPEGIHKDGAKAFPTWAAADAFLAGFPLAPSLLVRTGYGYSAWWLLDEPTDAATATPLIAALATTVARLSDGRADPAVYEVARMMRLPGTPNMKRPEHPVPAELTEAHDARRYSPAELTEALDTPATVPTGHTTPRRRPTGAPTDAGGRPGDHYSTEATTETIVELLVAHGCTEVDRTVKDGRLQVMLARPGKDPREGHSMSVGFVGEGVTYVFSSGWDRVPKGTHPPFRLYALLEHAGDYAAAARQLRALGYGEDPTALLPAIPELTDADLAEAFTTDLAGELTYVTGIGWMAWEGTVWVEVTEARLLVRLATFVKRVEATIRAAGLPEEREKALLKAAHQYLNTNARSRVLRDAAGRVEHPAAGMDRHTHLLNTPNGVVDLRTGDLGPHDPALYMTKMTRARYRPGAGSADWAKALSGLPEDLAGYLQVALGLGATGESVADQVFIAVGSGGNGKSTIFGAVRHALGSYAVTIPAKLFTAEGATQTQLLMPLRGARMALAAESGEDHYLNMERLKALSGGDELQDRHLYSRTFATWAPTHTMYLMTNHRPRVRNSDEGTWRRLQLIPFTASYTRPEDRDVNLRDRLVDDDHNAEAVLAWVVAGAVHWLTHRRLPSSVDVDLASTEWRDDEDPVASYFREAGWEVTGTAGDTVRAGDLYTRYRDHTVTNGGRPFSASSWKREMERYSERRRLAGSPTFSNGRDKHGLYWRGLRKATEEATGFRYPGWSPPPPDPEAEAPAAAPKALGTEEPEEGWAW